MQPLQTIKNDTAAPLTSRQHALYCELRQASAVAGGLEAIASNAIDAGEATAQQLDHIVDLCGHLIERLGNLAHGIIERPEHH